MRMKDNARMCIHRYGSTLKNIHCKSTELPEMCVLQSYLNKVLQVLHSGYIPYITH